MNFPVRPKVALLVESSCSYGRELLTGFKRFACCGSQFTHYSACRLMFFHEMTAAADFPLSVFELPGEAGQCHERF